MNRDDSKSGDSPSYFCNYLRKAVKNATIDALRKRGRRREVNSCEGHEVSDVPAPSSELSHAFENEELIDWLLEGLDERTAQVMRLLASDMTLQEVGQLVDPPLSIPGVHHARERGYLHMRERLRDHGLYGDDVV
jgi:RNA polymerase sigma factor (sigma-70 family)